MNFGEKITALRKQAGLSQEALAEKLGVSRQAVGKWEKGEAQPELSKLLALCDLFGVTPDQLLGYEKAPLPLQPQRAGKSSRVAFWLVVGCMGFIVAAFCLGWSIAHPWVYNGIKGLRGSLLGNDCMELFIIGTAAMIFGLFSAYFEISSQSSFFAWLKEKTEWLHDELFKDGNAVK